MKRIRIQKILIALVLMVNSIQLMASDELMSEKWSKALTLYKKGFYLSTIKELDKIIIDDLSDQDLRLKHYLAGMSYNRLEEFDKGVKLLERAASRGLTSNDIYYELGQGYYALRKFKNSIKMFKKSKENKFQPTQSCYYIADIYHGKKKFSQAKRYYQEIVDSNDDSAKLVQLAMYKLGEIALETSGKNRQEIRDKVIPMYERARDYDPESTLRNQIQTRIIKLRKDYRVVRKDKKWIISLSEKITYDSNITYEPEVATIKATNIDSWIFKTEVFGNYRFDVSKKFKIVPEIAINNTYHKNQDNPLVYQNDAYSINPALRFRIPHAKTNILMIDGEFSYSARDRDQKHSHDEYGSSKAIIVGERWGSNTLQFKYMIFDAFAPNLDYKSMDISFGKWKKITSRFGMNGGLRFERLDAINTDTNTDTYGLQLGATGVKLFKYYTTSCKLGFNIIDFPNLKVTRGHEKKVDGQLSFGRAFFRKKLNVEISYNFIKNWSKTKTLYQYKKHILGVQGVFTF